MGLSHEAAIAFHRVLGRATLILVSGHFGFYGLAWALDGGAKLFWDEILTSLPPRAARHESAIGPGLPAGCTASRTFWVFGLGLPGSCWASAASIWCGAESYALFMATHQLHWLWWFFACLHYPGALAFWRLH